ncbi:MAG TPA: hypothetical protein VF753_04960, partial [Terriglobales bacterium]
MRASMLLLWVLFAIPFLCAQEAPSNPQRFDPHSWIEDFHQLLHEMSTHYANLEWAVNDRRMDLPDLRRKTEDAIQHAQSEAEAHAAFKSFLDAFGDGHLQIEWQSADSGGQETASRDVCERLGYHPRGKPGIDYSLLSELSSVPSAEEKLFPGGLLKAGGRRFGLIRIGNFMEKAFPDVCHQAVQQLDLSTNTACDDACADKVELKTADLLTAALTARADQLHRAGATALLIDITRNGGGSDWVDAASRA